MKLPERKTDIVFRVYKDRIEVLCDLSVWDMLSREGGRYMLKIPKGFGAEGFRCCFIDPRYNLQDVLEYWIQLCIQRNISRKIEERR